MHFSSAEDHHPLSHDPLHHSSQPPHPHTLRIGTLASHPSLELPYDSQNSIFQHHLQRLDTIPTLPVAHADFSHHAQDSFERRQPPPPSSTRSTSILRQPSIPHSAADLQSPTQLTAQNQHQFGTLTSTLSIPVSQPGGVPQISRTEERISGHARPASSTVISEAPEQRSHGQLVTKIVIDPPNLRAWREKLFNVDDTITLTNEECASPPFRPRFLSAS